LTWKIDFDRDAAKDLKKLGKPIQKQIISYLKNKISKLEDPRLTGKPLKGPLRSKIYKNIL